MTTESHITQEARDFIGKRGEVRTALVTEQAIRRFSVAIGDKNPLWRDAEYAKAHGHEGIIAPPFFYNTLALEEEDLEDLEHSGLGKKMGLRTAVPVPGFPGAVAGGRHATFGVPIRAGDVITMQEQIVDIYEKPGRRGPMIFVTSEETFTNQRGETCVSERKTTIRIR